MIRATLITLTIIWWLTACSEKPTDNGSTASEALVEAVENLAQDAPTTEQMQQEIEITAEQIIDEVPSESNDEPTK